MAKAQPAMSINIDISKKFMTDLTNCLTDFNDHSVYRIIDADYKKANVSSKELKAKLLDDKELKNQIRNSIKDLVAEHLKDIIADPYGYYVGYDIDYLETQMEAVEQVARERYDADLAADKAEGLANEIKAAVELLKKAGYKVSE